LTAPDLKLNDGFVPDRRALRSLVRFKARTALWSVEFEREALSGGKIRFDPADNTLTITDLPEELTTQLRAELATDA
jgi:nucleoid-associated protein